MSNRSDAPSRDRLYRLLVEQVTDYAIFALDPTGHVITWNPGAQRFKGYTADEIIGRHFSIFYAPEDKAAGLPQRLLGQAAETGHAEAQGWRVRKDGSRFWAQVTITALRDDDGRLTAFAKITRDLTAQRAAEERARRLAAEEAAHAATIAKNRELEDLNRLLQEQATELEAQTEEAQSLTEELEQSTEELQQTLAEAEEARDAAKRGEQANRFLARASEILGSSLDYEKTLNELARLAVPELADWCGVDVADDEGRLHQVAVAHVNEETARWGRELNRRYPPRPDAPAGAYNVLRTGKPELYPEITDDMLVAGAIDDAHLEVTRSLGMRSALIVPLAARDRTLGVLTLVAAESGRRYTEADLSLASELAHRAAMAVENARLHSEALEARDEAQRANRAKMEFLATMSHELRTPLNAISGYTDLLKLGIKGSLSAEQNEYLDRIERSGRYLLSLIQDVLSFAKLESGRVEINIATVPIPVILNEMEQLMMPQAQAANLALHCDRCPRDVAAKGDPERIRQILVNLLSNAVKFTPAGGHVSVGCEAEDGRVKVRVCDTGPGIPTEKLEEVFAPFVQLQRDLRGSQAGTGLGLSISRDLARAMNGDLLAESRVNEGSTFTLVLPRA